MSEDVLMLLAAVMASCDALLVGALIGAPCAVDPIVVSPGTVGIGSGVAVGVGTGVGSGVGSGVGVVGLVFTDSDTDHAEFRFPAASVNLLASTETTPVVVLFAVGVKVAV